MGGSRILRGRKGMIGLFNSPNQWLRDALQRAQFSAHSIARQLRIDAAQVSRWLNEKERVPCHHLSELAEILCSRDLSYVVKLKTCEELEEQLNKAIRALAGDEEQIIPFLVSRVANKLAAVLDQEIDTTPEEHASLGIRFLTAAQFAVRCATTLRDFPNQPLVNTENIHRHIKYPYNHFTGLLLELSKDPDCPSQWLPLLENFRESALRSLRRTSKPDNDSSRADVFIRYHSRHLLARHGERSDQDSIRRILKQPMDGDPMARRLEFSGLSLAGTDQEIGHRYLHEVCQHDAMRLANIAFDAIHYDCMSLDDQSNFPRCVVSLKPVVKHVLRHILHHNHYQSIQAVEEQTICDIFALFGDDAFRKYSIIDCLHKCLFEKNITLLSDRFRLTAGSILRQPAIQDMYKNTSHELEQNDAGY